MNHGLKQDGARQNVAGMEIYPIDYFCPKSFATGRINKTDNTYSIHHFDGSWHGKNGMKYIQLMRLLNRMFGVKNGQKIFEGLMEFKDKLRGK